MIGNDSIAKVNNYKYLGVLFNYKGMDVKNQILETKLKLSKTIQFFNMLGMNKGGFRLKTNILLYKSFIRSRMEYGLAIFKANKNDIKNINVIQHSSLCRMFSVNGKSSGKTLEIVTGISDMAVRSQILKAK